LRKKTVIATIAVVVIALIFLTMYGFNKKHHAESVRSAYQQAQDMLLQGLYDNANSILKEIAEEEYSNMDITELLQYCDAQIKYESGDIAGAYNKVNSLILEHVDETLQDELKSFQKQIAEEYEVYLAEQEAAERAAYEDNIINGVPYVGMPESRIADTSLGEPSETVRHNREMINGESYIANLYDFVENGVRYFTARCVQGKVIQVWDNRNKLDSSNSSSSESNGSSSGGRVIGGNSSSSNNEIEREADGNDYADDPYNVYDYDDPEEFYYDNCDDFDGYEDAEIYWDDAWR